MVKSAGKDVEKEGEPFASGEANRSPPNLKSIKHALQRSTIPQRPVTHLPTGHSRPKSPRQFSAERVESAHDGDRFEGETPALPSGLDTTLSGSSGQRRSTLRTTLRSVVHQPEDPALNVQTSRWQSSGHNPPRILRGQRIYVDASGRYGRKQTLRNITVGFLFALR
jgi:hypothetical protein